MPKILRLVLFVTVVFSLFAVPDVRATGLIVVDSFTPEMAKMATFCGFKDSGFELRPNAAAQGVPLGHTFGAFVPTEFLYNPMALDDAVATDPVIVIAGDDRRECPGLEIDDVVVGALLGIANSYLAAQPSKGWEVQVDGDARSVAANLTFAW